VKHLVDLDDDALERARRHLGLPTIKATVNAALRLAADRSPADDDLDDALTTLASVEFEDRSAAWR
jgi:Arc/MetJ family transcription regulator